jgi:hypothetical protein
VHLAVNQSRTIQRHFPLDVDLHVAPVHVLQMDKPFNRASRTSRSIAPWARLRTPCKP